MADPLLLDLYLKTLCPMHIGCDEVYEPTGFVIDENESCLIAFDTEDLLEHMKEDKRKEFTNICKEGSVASLLKIYQFFSHIHSRTKIQGRKIKVCKGLVDHYKKTLNLPRNNERVIVQELNNFAISRTSYDPHSNLPYIPGSSIKGAIRTAYLNLRQRELKTPKESNAKTLEKKLLGDFRNFDEDPFRLLKVSDFFPLPETATQIKYVISKKRKPSSFESRGLPLILEVIPPGSIFKGTLRIEKPLKRDIIAYPLNLKDLVQSLNQFYRKEKDLEGRDLANIGVQQVTTNPEKWLVRIGRHSGAECVTIEGQRSIKILGAKGAPPKYLEKTTTIWLASDKNNPSGNSDLSPMGWAEFGKMTPELQERFQTRPSNATKDAATTQKAINNPLPSKEIVYEIWEGATLEFLAGQGIIKVKGQSKTAECKDKNLVPETLQNTLFKKKKRVTANVKVQVESSAYFKVVEISKP